VLGLVKAWPGRTAEKGKTSVTASLDGPLRAARLRAQAGTKEWQQGTNKGMAQMTNCR